VIVTPAEALASVARPPAARGRRTLTELAQGFLRWLDAHHRPQTTIASYGDGLGAFLTFATAVGMVYPDQVTVVSLDGDYVWLRSRGKSANTMAHRRSVLIAVWKWLEHEGFAERNVPAKTYPIKTPRRLPIYREPHQIDDFLAKLGALTHLAGQRDHAVVATFFYSGVRVSELASLRVADVDLVAGRIRVNQGKGGKDRIVYVPPRLQPILARYLANVRPRLVGRLVRGAVPPDVGWLFVNAHPASAHRLNPRGQSLAPFAVVVLGDPTSRFDVARREALAAQAPAHLRDLSALPRRAARDDSACPRAQRRPDHDDLLAHAQKRQEEESGKIFG